MSEDDFEPPDYPDYDDPQGDNGQVLVFRNGAGDPIAVPSDVVTAAERAYRCHKARIGGKSWEQIAEEEQYPSAAACKYDVDRYLEEGKALVVESSQRQMLTLEVARMDALQSAIWPQAMMGHVPSVTAALSIIKERSRLVGLDPEKMAEQAEQARTVIHVPQDSQGYIASLQRAAGPATLGTSTVDSHESDPDIGD